MADIYIGQDYWKLWRGSPSAYFISISPDNSHRVLYSQDGVSSREKALRCILRKTHKTDKGVFALTLYDIKNLNSNQPFKIENVLTEGKTIVITSHFIWDLNVSNTTGFSLCFCANVIDTNNYQDAGREHIEAPVNVSPLKGYFCSFYPLGGTLHLGKKTITEVNTFIYESLGNYTQGCLRFSVLIPPNSLNFFVSAEIFSSGGEYILPELTSWPIQINDDTYRTGQIFILLHELANVGMQAVNWMDFFYIQERS